MGIVQIVELERLQVWTFTILHFASLANEYNLAIFEDTYMLPFSVEPEELCVCVGVCVCVCVCVCV